MRAHFGLVWPGFRPLAQWGQNPRFCDRAGMRHPFASPFRAINIVSIRVDFAPLPHQRAHVYRVGECGRIPPLFCSHAWYVQFYRLILDSHVSDIILCRLSPTWHSQHHWGWPCELFFVWGPDPYLDRPHRFPFVQAGLESIVLSYPYGFRPFLCVGVKYFITYSHFSLNLYPPSLPPIFSFRTRYNLFLGGL